ncbi:phosphoesterase, partial [Clostridium sp.]|uniref:phosphoesterase n=1 Tax=Clostridium sp. TaxID=1506 RepID=UPI0034648C3B
SKVIKNHVDMLGASLIISLGCIIESRDQENLINNLGMEVIALLNREYNEDLESIVLGNDTLSISTLTFKLAQAIASYYNMKSINKYIDLVTIGTYSFSDKISGENKILFEEGIKYLLNSNNYGLRALMTYNGITTPSEENISKMVLVMTPRVNAVGTIDNARIVVELLTTTSEYRAQQIVKYLEKELKND